MEPSTHGKTQAILLAAAFCVGAGWLLSSQHAEKRMHWTREAQRASEALSSLEDIASRVAESERGRFGYAAGEGNELLSEAREALKLARGERDRLSPRLGSSATERQRLELLTGLLDDSLSLQVPGEVLPNAAAKGMALTLVSPKGKVIPAKKGPPAKPTPIPILKTPGAPPISVATPVPLPKVRQLGDLARAVLRDLADDEMQARKIALNLEAAESRSEDLTLAVGSGLGLFLILWGAFRARSESKTLRAACAIKSASAQDSLEILNRVENGLAIFDPESGAITGVNERFVELSGYPKGQLLSGGALPLLPPDPASPSLDAIRLVQKAGRDGTADGWVRIRHRTGTERYCRAIYRRCALSGASRVVGVFQDVGELHSKFTEVSAEADRWKTLYGPASAPALLIDPETGKVIEATEAVGLMFSCSPEAILEGRPDPLSTGPDPYSRITLLSHFDRAFNMGPQTFEWAAPDSRGRKTEFQAVLQRISLGDQNLLLAVLKDLHTEKRQNEKIVVLEENLEAAQAREKLLQRETADRASREDRLREEMRRAESESSISLGKVQGELRILQEQVRKAAEDKVSQEEWFKSEKASQEEAFKTEKAALEEKLEAAKSSQDEKFKEESKRLLNEAKDGLDRVREDVKRERDAREHLAKAVAALPGVVFALDATGTFRLLEGRDLLKLGLAPAELVGQKAGAGSRGLPRSAETLRRALGGETIVATEEIGGIVWEIHLSPLKNAENLVTGVLGAAHDTTERDRSSKSSRERLDALVSLLEATPEAYFLTDPEGHVTFAGGGALPGLGLAPWDAMGKSLEEITPEPGDWHDALQKAQTSGSAPVNWNASGSESFKGLLTVLKDSSGNQTGFGGMLWPAQHEVALTSPENWSAVAEAVSAALLSLSPEGVVVKANAAAARLLSKSVADCEGKKMSALAPESWRAQWEALLEKGLKERVDDEPIYLSRGDGGDIELLATLAPLPAVDGKSVGITLALRDLAAKTREEQATRNYLLRLEQSQHEILQATGPAVGRLLEDIEKIHRHAAGLKERAGWAINPEGLSHLDNLQGAATDAGMRLERWFEYQLAVSQDLHSTAVDLSQALKDTATEMKESFDKIGAKLEVDDLPMVEADPDLLRLMFRHLLGNALHHPVPDRPLVVKIKGAVIRAPERSLSPGWCQMEIEDNGQGLPAEETDRMFLPPSLETLHTRPGAGLGLLICRRVAERHGGTISAKSVQGQGTTLIVVLPLIQRKV